MDIANFNFLNKILTKLICYESPDIDECSLSIDDCHPNSNCTNIDGSFLCACDSKFEGNEILCQGKDEIILHLVRVQLSFSHLKYIFHVVKHLKNQNSIASAN